MNESDLIVELFAQHQYLFGSHHERLISELAPGLIDYGIDSLNWDGELKLYHHEWFDEKLAERKAEFWEERVGESVTGQYEFDEIELEEIRQVGDDWEEIEEQVREEVKVEIREEFIDTYGSFPLDEIDAYVVSTNLWERNSFSPGHITASGIVRCRNDILLIRHTRFGEWMQPGGHYETSDFSTEETARREIAEETGIEDLELVGLIDVDVHHIPTRFAPPTAATSSTNEMVQHYGYEPEHLHFDLRYGFRTNGKERIKTSEASAAWVPIEHTLRLDLSVRRPIVNLLRRESQGMLFDPRCLDGTSSEPNYGDRILTNGPVQPLAEVDIPSDLF